MAQDIEIAVEIRMTTDKAYKVFDGKSEVWVPKSQVSDYCRTNGKITSIIVPEWLAKEKGLI